jgi:hypothetical protein
VREYVEAGEGFQVFVVPYAESSVTAERFKKDDPSCVMKDAKEITVDGTPAKSFFGHNEDMGDIHEVWFIHGGYYTRSRPTEVDAEDAYRVGNLYPEIQLALGAGSPSLESLGIILDDRKQTEKSAADNHGRKCKHPQSFVAKRVRPVTVLVIEVPGCHDRLHSNRELARNGLYGTPVCLNPFKAIQ